MLSAFERQVAEALASMFEPGDHMELEGHGPGAIAARIAPRVAAAIEVVAIELAEDRQGEHGVTGDGTYENVLRGARTDALAKLRGA